MRTTGIIRLTQDPELRDADVGEEKRVVCTMRCAMRGSRGRDAGFVDVVAWGPLGERCAKYLVTGSAALVDGHLRHDEWTNVDGDRRQRHSIVAEDVQFLSKPAQSDEAILVDGIEF